MLGRRDNQFAGPGARRALGIALVLSDQGEAARRRRLHDGRVAIREHAERGPTRPAERVVSLGIDPATFKRGEQRLGGALSAVAQWTDRSAFRPVSSSPAAIALATSTARKVPLNESGATRIRSPAKRSVPPSLISTIQARARGGAIARPGAEDRDHAAAVPRFNRSATARWR